MGNLTPQALLEAFRGWDDGERLLAWAPASRLFKQGVVALTATRLAFIYQDSLQAVVGESWVLDELERVKVDQASGRRVLVLDTALGLSQRFELQAETSAELERVLGEAAGVSPRPVPQAAPRPLQISPYPAVRLFPSLSSTSGARSTTAVDGEIMAFNMELARSWAPHTWFGCLSGSLLVVTGIWGGWLLWGFSGSFAGMVGLGVLAFFLFGWLVQRGNIWYYRHRLRARIHGLLALHGVDRAFFAARAEAVLGEDAPLVEALRTDMR